MRTRGKNEQSSITVNLKLSKFKVFCVICRSKKKREREKNSIILMNSKSKSFTHRYILMCIRQIYIKFQISALYSLNRRLYAIKH